MGEDYTYHKITLGDTMGILDSIIRRGVENYSQNEMVGLPVPRSIRTVDSIMLHPEKCFSKAVFAQKQSALNKQRAQELDRYPGLHRKIREVFQKPTRASMRP